MVVKQSPIGMSLRLYDGPMTNMSGERTSVDWSRRFHPNVRFHPGAGSDWVDATQTDRARQVIAHGGW